MFAGELLELAGKTSCLHALQLEVTNTESYPEVVKQVKGRVAKKFDHHKIQKYNASLAFLF